MTAPLEGLRVLDLSRILAGPFCTMMLGDMGAEIIKVEHPKGGDDTRSWPPFYEGGESMLAGAAVVPVVRCLRPVRTKFWHNLVTYPFSLSEALIGIVRLIKG